MIAYALIIAFLIGFTPNLWVWCACPAIGFILARIARLKSFRATVTATFLWWVLVWLVPLAAWLYNWGDRLSDWKTNRHNFIAVLRMLFEVSH